jgi:2-polyprenyl-3-methyl-5-hydroxy-6-metoxy-1,4-benzoquinol methylase
MEDSCCNICKKNSIEYVGSIDALRYDKGTYFNLWKCQNCDLIFVNPQPDDESLKLYYSKNYGPHNPRSVSRSSTRNAIMSSLRKFTFAGQSPGNIKKCLSVLYNKTAYRSIPPYRLQGKLLDIGSGIGSYLSLMKSLGWKVFGTEANKDAASHSENIEGLKIQKGKFEDIDYPDGYFDVITMWHSLEHFNNPRNALLKVRRILKQGGQLLIGLPNYSSLDRKIFRESWNGFEIPIHLFHFSPDSIGRLLKHLGFSRIKIVHTIRPSDMAKSLRNYLSDHDRLTLPSFINPILFLVAIPFSLLFAFLERSSIMLVTASKFR